MRFKVDFEKIKNLVNDIDYGKSSELDVTVKRFEKFSVYKG